MPVSGNLRDCTDFHLLLSIYLHLEGMWCPSTHIGKRHYLVVLVLYRTKSSMEHSSAADTTCFPGLEQELTCCLLTLPDYQRIPPAYCTKRNGFDRKVSTPSLFHPKPHSPMLSFATRCLFEAPQAKKITK